MAIEGAPDKVRPKVLKKKKRRAQALSNGVTTVMQHARLLSAPGKPSPWDWWKSIGSPRHIMSPMVGQSELAFRKLCRQHGTTLCYTPMLISKVFASSAGYRRRMWQTCPEDRPLIAQFCGNEPRALVQAALMVQDHVDAVDFNLGCPQTVAQRGNYGSWLMDKDWGLLRECVGSMAKALKVPVSVKIRRFEDVEKTISYGKMLQDAGASLLTLHARQRHEKCDEVMADWSQTAGIKRALSIPVIGNGDVYHAEDAWLFQRQTGIDGVMSAQGLLYNPALFEPLLERGLENGPTAAHLASQRTPDVRILANKLLPQRMRRRRQLSAFMTFRISCAFKRQPIGNQRQDTAKNSALMAAPEELVLPGSSSTFMSTPEDVKKCFDLAEEYLRCCFDDHDRMNPAITPCHPSVIRRHIFFILFDPFQANCDLIDELSVAGGKPDHRDSHVQKSQKGRIFTDTSGARSNLGMRYFRDSSSKPYQDVIDKLRARAERGSPHPDALAAVDNLKANGNPRTRRRDGTFAPPEWPEGGGGFHVEKRSAEAIMEAKKQALRPPELQVPPERSKVPVTTGTANHDNSSESPKLSKAERKRKRTDDGVQTQIVNSNGAKAVEIVGDRRLSKAERKRQRTLGVAATTNGNSHSKIPDGVSSSSPAAPTDGGGATRKLSKAERKQLKNTKH